MKYVGAIDQGTSSSRFILFDENGRTVASHQTEFPQHMPQNGWVEHDPMLILESVNACIAKVMQTHSASDVVGLGITNQRETTVVWDRITGKPLYNAIVWLDTRTADLCDRLTAAAPGGTRDAYRSICGLPISTYFSGVKLRWLLDNIPAVREAADQGRAAFGTIESWLIWCLSGGLRNPQKALHITDVTNASRTMLMDLKTRQWDQSMLQAFGIPSSLLPRITSNSEVFGSVAEGPLAGVNISGAIGDQQGALLGQLCVNAGEAKNTYGTGCFMLLNTGAKAVQSTHGLLTTVGMQLGSQAETQYALEGSIAIAGASVKWLRDNMGLIASAKELEPLARQVPDCGGVYFVPAFSGLFAPRWREDARGAIVGLTQYTTKHHLARATYEAVCFQTCDVMQAMEADSGVHLQRLRVDGGMTASDLMLQTQADLLGIPIERAIDAEATALGAAVAAGLAVGFWRDTADVIQRVRGAAEAAHVSAHVFRPAISAESRVERMRMWNKAVQRSLAWVEHKL